MARGRSASRGAAGEGVGIVGKAAKKTIRPPRRRLTAAQRAARERAFRERVAGTTHPRTGVRYDENGFPEFPSQHEYPLPADQIGPHITDTAQMRLGTQDLQRTLADNPALRRQFTDEQLAAIDRGAPRIPGYRWHHHQDGVNLQLVRADLHDGTFHYGGRAATGGRS